MSKGFNCKRPRIALARVLQNCLPQLVQTPQPIEISCHSHESWELLTISDNNTNKRDMGDLDAAGPMTQESDDAQRYGTSIKRVEQSLPPEVWYDIVKFAAQIPAKQRENAGGYICGRMKKNSPWNVASVSKFLRQIVLEHWSCVFHLREQKDLDTLRLLGQANGVDIFRFVRHVICINPYEVYRAPKDSFQVFRLLEELVLDCHRDINFGEPVVQHAYALDNALVQAGTNEGHLQPGLLEHGEHHDNQNNEHQQDIVPQPRMSYRRLGVRLPHTLQRLKVYNAHVPDIYIIKKVVAECPLLRSLTLARCTIFTCVQCEFWKRLPRTESDAYFSNEGVTSYAGALGRELRQIERLAEIKLGIYLTEHAAIDTHITQHLGLNLAHTDPAVWEYPCEECSGRYKTATLELEREATVVLAKTIPTLFHVSWASFCSIGRKEWSTHQILRDEKGQFQGLVSARACPE